MYMQFEAFAYFIVLPQNLLVHIITGYNIGDIVRNKCFINIKKQKSPATSPI